MKNLHFNRVEKKGRHIYIDDFDGIRKFEMFEHDGFIKCKLVHNTNYSIVLPEQIYVAVGREIEWIQPLYFSGNIIGKFDDFSACDLSVDISFGQCLRIRFRNDDLASRLSDGSLIYKCKIKGPKLIYPYTTGEAKFIAGKPFLKLYHHTSRKSKEGILAGGEYWSSNWNIQGTKKSTNISYLYLTPLPKITTPDDLTQIAMSSQGRLALRIDSNQGNNPNLVLNVYRESTDNRTHTLPCWVESSLLSTQPCYRHTPPIGFGYHAIVSPFIHRIGVEYGTRVQIEGNRLKPYSPKALQYAVVGDATKVTGLAAPYDEEETQEILKIEIINEPLEITSFWMENANTDQFSGKSLESVKFDS